MHNIFPVVQHNAVAGATEANCCESCSQLVQHKTTTKTSRCKETSSAPSAVVDCQQPAVTDYRACCNRLWGLL